jgi:hypothetical protein
MKTRGENFAKSKYELTQDHYETQVSLLFPVRIVSSEVMKSFREDFTSSFFFVLRNFPPAVDTLECVCDMFGFSKCGSPLCP